MGNIRRHWARKRYHSLAIAKDKDILLRANALDFLIIMAHNQAPDAAANAAVGGANGGAMVVRPAVMPEAYNGVGDWVEYLQYFNQCARVNEWNDVQKAQYLAVRLRGAAQKFVATVPEAAEWSGLRS